MIDPKQLRIGNYVMYNGHKMSVYSISGAYPRREKRYDGKVVLDLFDGAGIISVPLDEIKPVTIIQDRLISKGFQYVKPRKDICTAMARNSIRIEISYSGDYHFKKRVLNGMHQVQNIYFELTGKEL